LEQARRSALAHHDHRPAPVGMSVLINAGWYKLITELAQQRGGLDEADRSNHRCLCLSYKQRSGISASIQAHLRGNWPF
ncbi:hypothetical protein, partial [Sphingomonas xinjiangensis]|uniref:hypothetical protein n=1 Tax=Sphingomonas xinjiangensis TaxID=643568 RepID=UPI001C843E7A